MSITESKQTKGEQTKQTMCIALSLCLVLNWFVVEG